MKNRIITIVLVSFSLNALTQELSGSLSYNYMYSKQLDKAIQTYNFSRPSLTEKQPLFMNGLNASTTYLFLSEKRIKRGINLSYSHFRSSAENENIENTYNIHFLNFGYFLHYENSEKRKGLYTDLIFSITSSALFRKNNGDFFTYDETISKAFGVGGDLSLRFGYQINIKNKTYLSPFLLVAYSPYFYSPNSEAVINQTKGLTGKEWTSILATQIGVMFHFKKL